jgi:hypothetical protein
MTWYLTHDVFAVTLEKKDESQVIIKYYHYKCSSFSEDFTIKLEKS